MNYQIKGNFNYHLDILASQLNETSNITINAFTSKSNKIPIGCKFQWYKISDTERIKIESQGNIYQCSIFDIGYKIEANVQSFETGQEGQAIVEFQKIQISSQLEIKLSQLYHNNMKQQIIANDQNWIFSLDYLENSTLQQKITYSNQQLLPSQNQLQAHFMNQVLKFKSKEDKDSFCAFFVSMQGLKRVHIKFIAYNIGKINEKQINFQQLLNSQLLQLMNEKIQLGPRKLEIQQSFNLEQRTTNQINQLKQEISILQNQKQKQQQQIEKLNKELEQNSKSKDQIDSLDRLIQSLKNELFSLKQRESDLMNQNAKLTILLNDKDEKFENSLSQSQIFDNQEIKQYQEFITESNQGKQKLYDELTKGQKQNQQYKSSLTIELEREKLIQTNQKLMQEIQNQNKIINELQIEIQMLKNMSHISMNMQQIEDPMTKTKFDQIEQENIYLQKKIDILEDEIQKKKLMKTQKSQIDKDLQIQQLCEANKRYLNENIKLYEEIRSIRDKLDSSQIINYSIKNSNIHENILCNQLQQQIQQMQSMHNTEIQQLKKKVEKASSDLQDAQITQKQQEQLEKQNRRLAEENLYLQEKIKNLADLNQSKSFSVNMTNIIQSDQYKELEEQLNLQRIRFQEVQQRLDFQLQRDTQQQDKIKQYEVELLKYQNQLLKGYEFKSEQDGSFEQNTQIDLEMKILIQEKEYLVQKIKQQDNQTFELKQKLMQLQEENRTLKLFPQNIETQLKQQISQLQLQNQNLTGQIVKLQNQQNIFKDLSQSHISMNESIFESKVYEGKEYKLLENQKELLHLENQQLKQQINKDVYIQQENQELKMQLDNVKNQLYDKIQFLENELQNKITHNEKLTIEIEKLNNMKVENHDDSLMKNLKLQVINLQQENSKLIQDITNCKSTIHDKSCVDQINQSYSKRLTQDSDDQSQLISQLRIQLAEKSHQLKIVSTNYQQSNEDLQLIINRLGQENQNISEVHNSIKARLELQISKLIEQLKDKDQQFIQLQEDLQKKTNQIEQLIQQNKSQALQINTLNFELQELKLINTSKFKEDNRELQISNIKLSHSNFEQEKSQSKTIINELLSENSKFSLTIQKLQKELNESQIKLLQKIDDYQKILQIFQSTQIESENLRKDNQTLSQQLKEYNQEIVELKIKIRQMNSQNLIDENQQSIKSNQIMNQTILQLQQKYSEIELKCKQQLQESQDLTTCISKKDFQLKQQTQQNLCLSKELDNQQEKNLHFKKQISELSQLIKNKENETQDLQLQIKDLENTLLIKNKTILDQNNKLIEFEKLMSFDKSSDSYLITKNFHTQFNNSQEYAEKYSQDNQNTILNNHKHKNQIEYQTKNMMDIIEKNQQIELQNQKLSTESQIQTTRLSALQQELLSLKGQNQKLYEQILQQEEHIRLLKQNQLQQIYNNNNHYQSRLIQNSNQNELTDMLSIENQQLNEQNQNLEKQVQEFVNQNNTPYQKNTISDLHLIQFEYEQLKIQNSKLLEIIKQQQQQIDRLSKSNLSLMEENNRLNDQLKEVQNISYYSSDSQIH